MAQQPTNNTIVLTRDKSGNRAWAPHIRNIGFQVYELPTIQTWPLTLEPKAEAILRSLPDFDWIVFTSASSVRYTRDLVAKLGVEWPPGSPRIAVIGTQTRQAANTSGMRAAFQPETPDSRSLGNELPQIRGRRILIPRTTIASYKLQTILERRGGKVTSLPVYETRVINDPDTTLPEMMKSGDIGAIVFASPSAVTGFCRRVTTPQLPHAYLLPAIALGPGVAIALRGKGFQNIHVCREPSIKGVSELLMQLPGKS